MVNGGRPAWQRPKTARRNLSQTVYSFIKPSRPWPPIAPATASAPCKAPPTEAGVAKPKNAVF